MDSQGTLGASPDYSLIGLSVITGGGNHILVGTAVDYRLLLAGSLITSSPGIVVAYLIGGFAASQMQALAVVKICDGSPPVAAPG